MRTLRLRTLFRFLFPTFLTGDSFVSTTMSKLSLAIVLLAIATSNVHGNDVSGILNKKVDRTIDVTSQLVKITCRIQVENVGKTPITNYVVKFDPESNDNLAFISATIDKNAVQVTKETKGEERIWNVNLSEKPIAVGATGSLDIEAVISHSLKPFPREITQSEKQLVLLTGNHYLDTPYLTKSQTTKIKLPTGSVVETYSKLKPSSSSDNTITYGPYDNIAGNSVSKMEIHFENSSPFLSVTRLERTIEISHWASVISIVEDIDIRHDGAKLKGSFSRYDYQRETGSSKSSSVKNLKTKLPKTAFDVYYRDEIGNISTSNLRKTSQNVIADLRPRFPLFGGWKTHYILGYSIPASEYLFNDGNQLILRMPFVSHIHDNFVIDETIVKVVLPEGASDIKLRLPFSVTREKDQVMKSYLDTIGRTVIVLSKSNLVENHVQDFEVHYSYNRLMMLQEPMLIIIALFLLCFTIVVYVRLDFSLAKNPMRDVSQKVALIVENILNHQDKRASLYSQYDQATAKFKNNKDSVAYQAALKRINGDTKTETQSIADLIVRLKAEGASPELLEKINELQRLDKSLKEQLLAQTALVEKLVSGKLAKQSFLDSDKKIASQKEDIVQKLDLVTSCLSIL